LKGPVDLNFATQLQLEAVPGIGPALAERIINYRKEHGAFQTYEELDKVSGIGKSTLEKFRPFLFVK
jgi:competence protein ComEA